jgi:hypothetical protein
VEGSLRVEKQQNKPLVSVNAMAVAALLHCHSASGTFAVVDTEFGLNLNILADLCDDESDDEISRDYATHPSLQATAQCSPLGDTEQPRSGKPRSPAKAGLATEINMLKRMQ